jgi:hypothetical protein
MTEAEWLAATDATAMLMFVQDNATARQMRLFACGCLRAVWSHLKDWRSQAAVELAERYADMTISDSERQEAIDDAIQAASGSRTWAVWGAISTLQRSPLGARRCAPKRIRAALLRDIFGNPFRPVAVDPSWRTSTVVTLAEGIYADRAFDRLPILADALMDAGCDNADILAHCRGDGPHVRGCWVVDLVLGKS